MSDETNNFLLREVIRLNGLLGQRDERLERYKVLEHDWLSANKKLADEVQSLRTRAALLEAELARMRPIRNPGPEFRQRGSPVEPPSKLAELLNDPPRTICEVVQIGHSPQPSPALPDNESFCGEPVVHHFEGRLALTSKELEAQRIASAHPEFF